MSNTPSFGSRAEPTVERPPASTVRTATSQATFAAGHDVVVGRDLCADMRISHPLISRARLVLRYSHGRWVAIDNDSLNGTFVNGPPPTAVVEIHDGESINVGSPDGPQLTFEVGRHQGMAGRPPQTESMNIPAAAHPSATARPDSQTSGQPGHPLPSPPARSMGTRTPADLDAARVATPSRRTRPATGVNGGHRSSSEVSRFRNPDRSDFPRRHVVRRT